MSFRDDLERLIHQHGMCNVSNTPDRILAGYLMAALAAFDNCVAARDEHYGIDTRKKPEKEEAHGFAFYVDGGPTVRCYCGQDFSHPDALKAHRDARRRP